VSFVLRDEKLKKKDKKPNTCVLKRNKQEILGICADVVLNF
jgi:hypothetical protein